MIFYFESLREQRQIQFEKQLEERQLKFERSLVSEVRKQEVLRDYLSQITMIYLGVELFLIPIGGGIGAKTLFQFCKLLVTTIRLAD